MLENNTVKEKQRQKEELEAKIEVLKIEIDYAKRKKQRLSEEKKEYENQVQNSRYHREMTESNMQIEKLKKQIEDDSSKEHHSNKDDYLALSVLLPGIIIFVAIYITIYTGQLFTNIPESTAKFMSYMCSIFPAAVLSSIITIADIDWVCMLVDGVNNFRNRKLRKRQKETQDKIKSYKDKITKIQSDGEYQKIAKMEKVIQSHTKQIDEFTEVINSKERKVKEYSEIVAMIDSFIEASKTGVMDRIDTSNIDEIINSCFIDDSYGHDKVLKKTYGNS